MTAATALASYRPAGMTITPWGPTETLRSRRLRPGPGSSRDAVAKNQRERLMGATVAVVAERGYETTRVADILEVAGVSRSAYYHYFSNKEECFLATLDALRDLAAPIVTEAYRTADGPWDDRLRAAFDAIVELIVAQPAAARIWLIDGYSAGPAAVERVEALGDRLERFAAREIAESPERAGMPPGLVRALLGGVRQVIHNRLRHGLEAELSALAPDLMAWALSYRTPPEPLRRPRKVPALPPATRDENDQRARILAAVTDAVAEKGYADLTITEIAQRASVSLTTFYALFEKGKTQVFLAALDDGERRLNETVVPFYDRAPNWPQAIRESMHAVFAFLAGNPAAATLGGREVYAGGSAALGRQEKTRESFRALLYPGFKEHPHTLDIAGEAIGSAIASLVFQRLRETGPGRLYEDVSIAVYLALAPFLGAEEATAIANESWQPRP
jgi:AcrR family transcriptional regulator